MLRSRKLSDLRPYKISFHLSNAVWEIVLQWDILAQQTIGKQFINAIDSISANIAEGFGRWSKKDRVKFFRYSFGSMYESLDWNEKAKKRNLLTHEQYNFILCELQKLPKELNTLIKYTNSILTI